MSLQIYMCIHTEAINKYTLKSFSCIHPLEKLCLASYYIQFSRKIKMHIFLSRSFFILFFTLKNGSNQWKATPSPGWDGLSRLNFSKEN